MNFFEKTKFKNEKSKSENKVFVVFQISNTTSSCIWNFSWPNTIFQIK